MNPQLMALLARMGVGSDLDYLQNPEAQLGAIRDASRPMPKAASQPEQLGMPHPVEQLGVMPRPMDGPAQTLQAMQQAKGPITGGHRMTLQVGDRPAVHADYASASGEPAGPFRLARMQNPDLRIEPIDPKGYFDQGMANRSTDLLTGGMPSMPGMGPVPFGRSEMDQVMRMLDPRFGQLGQQDEGMLRWKAMDYLTQQARENRAYGQIPATEAAKIGADRERTASVGEYHKTLADIERGKESRLTKADEWAKSPEARTQAAIDQIRAQAAAQGASEAQIGERIRAFKASNPQATQPGGGMTLSQAAEQIGPQAARLTTLDAEGKPPPIDKMAIEAMMQGRQNPGAYDAGKIQALLQLMERQHGAGAVREFMRPRTGILGTAGTVLRGVMTPDFWDEWYQQSSGTDAPGRELSDIDQARAWLRLMSGKPAGNDERMRKFVVEGKR